MRNPPNSLLILLALALLLLAAAVPLALRAAAVADLLDATSDLVARSSADPQRIGEAAARTEDIAALRALVQAQAQAAQGQAELIAELDTNLRQAARWLVGLLVVLKLVIIAAIVLAYRQSRDRGAHPERTFRKPGYTL